MATPTLEIIFYENMVLFLFFKFYIEFWIVLRRTETGTATLIRLSSPSCGWLSSRKDRLVTWNSSCCCLSTISYFVFKQEGSAGNLKFKLLFFLILFSSKRGRCVLKVCFELNPKQGVISCHIQAILFFVEKIRIELLQKLHSQTKQFLCSSRIGHAF